jgi:hypothetical protein
MNVSISTARRMIRRGKLRHRIVPRPGGFAYLVYLPNSRHAGELGAHGCVSDETTPRSLSAYRRSRNGAASTEGEVQRLEQQVEHLSEALARALKTKQRSLPSGMGQPTVNAADPYARYRWLARRRRWWPFS